MLNKRTHVYRIFIFSLLLHFTAQSSETTRFGITLPKEMSDRIIGTLSETQATVAAIKETIQNLPKTFSYILVNSEFIPRMALASIGASATIYGFSAFAEGLRDYRKGWMPTKKEERDNSVHHKKRSLLQLCFGLSLVSVGYLSLFQYKPIIKLLTTT